MKTAQLFLLHFAGGNTHSLKAIASLVRGFDVIPLELPGRGKRIHEVLLHDFDQAAQDMFRQFVHRLEPSAPFLIYGHSMGAYLALRVANLLERTGRIPAHVIVSGNAGPGTSKAKQLHLLEYDSFIDEIRKLGGAPDELLENAELMEFFEPILRADFEIAENNGMDDEPAIEAPLYAMMGDQEENVDRITNWSRFTRSRFNYEILEGDHFFIYQHPQRVATVITECCAKADGMVRQDLS